MRPWNGHHFNPQSGFSNGDEGSHWLAPGKMRSSATGGRRGAYTSRAPTPQARTKGPTDANEESVCGSAKIGHDFLYFMISIVRFQLFAFDCSLSCSYLNLSM